VDFDTHKALELPKEERIAYLKVIASLAAADGEIRDQEIEHIRSTCRDFGLNSDEVDEIVSAARNPEQAEIQDTIKGLKDSPLRFTLLADLTLAAHADGRYTKDERIEIVEISQILDTTYDQLVAIDRRMEAERKAGTATAIIGLKSYFGIKWLAAKIRLKKVEK